MKFAKELEQDLVPEWRAKYFDYKTGKKKVKAVARALRNVNRTPRTPGRQKPSNLFSRPSNLTPVANRHPNDRSPDETSPDLGTPALTPKGSVKGALHGGLPGRGSHFSPGDVEGGASLKLHSTTPMTIPERRSVQNFADESSEPWDSGAVTNYGSIVSSPPTQNLMSRLPALELPDPAQSIHEEPFPRHNRAWRNSRLNPHTTPLAKRPKDAEGGAYKVGKTHTPLNTSSSLLPKHRRLFPHRSHSTPSAAITPMRPPFFTRMFSTSGIESSPMGDVPLEAFDSRQVDFHNFLDKELLKIESFYRMKEEEAGERLRLLRQQLHEMRDRRLEELLNTKRAQEHQRQEQGRHPESGNVEANSHTTSGSHNKPLASKAFNFIHPLESRIGLGKHRFGKNTRALEQLSSPPGPQPQDSTGQRKTDSWRDFTRRPTHADDVPYRSAKRKLRLALQEFYRGLELLKSYALLNRTAFRKINKKYDKAVSARPTGRYMSEKVNKAWFVQSEVLEGLIVAVEDLYARYFERGNHKLAVGKLRSKHARPGGYNGSVFRNGLLVAAGAVFAIEGVVYGAEHLMDPNPTVRVNTSYLLQIYAGYFLGLLLFLFFCIDCKIWTQAKINYVFIFEFDTRHNLDWHQLAELPCLLLFLMGLFIWLNFQQDGSNTMFLYWPVILIGLTVIILFNPLPVLYHKSREWWAYSNFRLLFAGWYPVEFRDFFLGDMYCSETYAMGNIELFFCLYARHWHEPVQCNSTHSRLLGFFSTVPGIWRALQCLRRYYDTRNAFPHLVNCGKYIFTILFYMSLSLYRTHQTMNMKALFIVCATVNSVYCSIWDLAMDWSLLNPYAEDPFLRDVLGYKSPSLYYTAMVIDPVLRFNWVFYAIFSSELQHSALLSFFVGFSEVFRRAMWTLFRVENEHCTNVGRFRASRDVPLPYEIPSPKSSCGDGDPTRPQDDNQPPESPRYQRRPSAQRPPLQSPAYIASGVDIENQSTPSLRRRPTVTATTPIQRGIARVATIVTQAHAQDFERKRKPGVVDGDDKYNKYGTQQEGSSEEEDEEEEDGENDSNGEDQQDVLDAEGILERHQGTSDQV